MTRINSQPSTGRCEGRQQQHQKAKALRALQQQAAALTPQPYDWASDPIWFAPIPEPPDWNHLDDVIEALILADPFCHRSSSQAVDRLLLTAEAFGGQW